VKKSEIVGQERGKKGVSPGSIHGTEMKRKTPLPTKRKPERIRGPEREPTKRRKGPTNRGEGERDKSEAQCTFQKEKKRKTKKEKRAGQERGVGDRAKV